jgi:hypothetical protein
MHTFSFIFAFQDMQFQHQLPIVPKLLIQPRRQPTLFHVSKQYRSIHFQCWDLQDDHLLPGKLVLSVMLYIVQYVTVDFLVARGVQLVHLSINVLYSNNCLISVASASFQKSFPFFLSMSISGQCV